MYKFEIRKKFVYGLTGNRIKFSEVLASWRLGWPSRGFVDLRFCNRKCNCAIRGAGELDKSWARTGSRKCWSTSTSSCSRPLRNAASLSPSYVARSRWCWPRTSAASLKIGFDRLLCVESGCWRAEAVSRLRRVSWDSSRATNCCLDLKSKYFNKMKGRIKA